MSDHNVPNQPVLDDFWQEASDLAGGGGGVIGFATIETGFKVYMNGMGNKASWFPAPNGKNNPQRAAVLEQAKAAAVSAGAPKPPAWGINMFLDVNRSYSKGVKATWKEDRYWTYDLFTDAARQIVLPALSKLSIHTPWSGWVRVGFAPDPFGGMDKDQYGEERIKQVAYVAEVFPTEAAAMAAANAGSETAPSFPPNYTESAWRTVIPMIKAEAAAGKTIDQLATQYAVAIPFIAAALAG